MDNQWVNVNCQVKGCGHQICQDKTACIMGKVNAVALADGLTSCPLSHVGAEIVTAQCCRELADHYWDYYDQRLSADHFVRVLQDAVLRQCQTPEQYTQMCSTLLFCAISEDTYLLGHIGDGAILQFGACCHTISPPQKTPIGGTATYTILDPDAGRQIEFLRGINTSCDGFLLTSDGLKDNVYCNGAVLPQHAFDLFHGAYELRGESPERRNREIAEILQTVFANRSEEADDCSIGILCRRKLTGLVDYEKENGVDVTVKWPCLCGAHNELNELRCGLCRRERSVIYQSVELVSTELFFGSLIRWLSSEEERFQFPTECGHISDPYAFDRLCRDLRSAPTRNTQHIIENSPRKLILTQYVAEQKNCFALYHHNGQAVVCEADSSKVVHPLGSMDDAIGFLSKLNRPQCASSTASHSRWILNWDAGKHLSVPRLLEQVIFRLDNGLLQADGSQYQWLYQINQYQSMVELCISERGSPEFDTVTFLHCPLCSWLICSQNGQTVLESLSPEQCQQYFTRLCQAIDNL